MQLALVVSARRASCGIAYSHPAGEPKKKSAAGHEITIIFAGDIMQHMPQVEAAWDSERNIYNYDTCFSYIKPFLSGG